MAIVRIERTDAKDYFDPRVSAIRNLIDSAMEFVCWVSRNETDVYCKVKGDDYFNRLSEAVKKVEQYKGK